MSASDRREAQRRETRARILEAARDLLLAGGVGGLTMRKLADRVGCTATNLYYHFADKDAVLRDLLAADAAALRSAMEAAADDPDPIARMLKMGFAYVAFGLDHPAHYRLLTMTPHDPVVHDPADPRRDDPAVDAYAFLRESTAGVIAAGLVRPEFADPDALAQIVWSATHGLVSLRLNFGDDTYFQWRPPAEAGLMLFRAMLRGVLVDSPD